MSDTTTTGTTPKIFRVTLEVGDLEKGTQFYARLLGTPGRRYPGARHYFDCGGVVLQVLDTASGGLQPHPNSKSLYFATGDLEAVHARAKELGGLAPFMVHDEPGGEIITRPWQERSFYAVDPWGNELCFVEEGTLYT